MHIMTAKLHFLLMLIYNGRSYGKLKIFGTSIKNEAWQSYVH